MLNGDRHASVSRALGPGLADTLLQPRFSPLAGALGGRERPVKSLTRAQGARRGLVKSRSERAPGLRSRASRRARLWGTTTWTGPTSSSRPCARATSSRSIFVWRRRAPPRPRRRASRLFQRSTCPSSRRPTTTPGSSPARPRTCDSATWRATTAGTNARWGSRRAAPTRVENGRGCRDAVASIAWGARHLISTQAPGA